MSATTIRNAMKTFLSNNLGPTAAPAGPIAQIETSYPRSLPESLQILAVIWPVSSQERRLAGGRGGLKEKTYRVLTHLAHYGVEPDMTDDAFLAVVDQVEALYRNTQQNSLNLNQAANTASSSILTFGEEMEVLTPQPTDLASGGIRNQFMLLQAIVVTQVVEIHNS